MAGIVFFRTRDLAALREFYVGRVGMTVWLEQADCTIFQHGNLLLGFCERDEPDTGGTITFYFETREEVDRQYERFRDCARDKPRVNEKYRIYNFFAADPDGRTIEFQAFLHPVPRVS
jgi:catechol 2,3-dioxygenase-like lactoylglutathione lyase family enzyme